VGEVSFSSGIGAFAHTFYMVLGREFCFGSGPGKNNCEWRLSDLAERVPNQRKIRELKTKSSTPQNIEAWSF
jgi:hypothetical protein